MVDIDLRLGDCLEILPTLETGSVDAVITDPPYVVTISSTSKNTPAFNKLKEHNWTLPYDWMIDTVRILKDGGAIYSWICPEEATILEKGLKSLGCKIHSTLAWVKTNPLPSYTKKVYRRTLELALYGAKGDTISYFAERTQQELRGIWYLPIVGGKKRTAHPSQKPLEIIVDWVVNSCPPGGVVLDPFMGSGTTGVACVQTGRNFIGIEIEEKYFNIAEKRIAEAQLQIRMEI